MSFQPPFFMPISQNLNRERHDSIVLHPTITCKTHQFFVKSIHNSKIIDALLQCKRRPFAL